ncbi:hypothetical protein H9Y04_24620 [Streptomyces sp. TRM66268-LWL]|uniref:Uncharacterized protein n=1 Tax=Streptomyces polyasparticus TaxID=2767826 RepID=A0ABR7SJR1_9ACTN|nr:hypothetical protein [Streptomyces polyasparticus]MBC9715731.1 hypothetical protein [Streptomyces polyasparticus]
MRSDCASFGAQDDDDHRCYGDNPAFITEDASGSITRNVSGIGSDLSAITSTTGNVVLQLANLHDDITVTLPLDPAQAPSVFAADEYGNRLSSGLAPRYQWLGAKQLTTFQLSIYLRLRRSTPRAHRWALSTRLPAPSKMSSEEAAAIRPEQGPYVLRSSLPLW